MKQLISIIFLIVSLSAYAQKSQINGKIDGIGNGTIDVLAMPLKEGETPIFDVANCTEGIFSYTLNYNVDMWHLVVLSSNEFQNSFGEGKQSNKELKNREIRFFIRPSQDIDIIASIARYGIKYDVTGNDINDQMTHTERMIFPLAEEYNRLTIQSEKHPTESEEHKLIDEKVQLINHQIDSIETSIIANHPDWEYSALLLPKYSLDTVAKFYHGFTPLVKNSFFGNYVEKTLSYSAKGTTVPDFTLPDNHDKLISLSDFKGKYVLLDFWGSWCGYCTSEFPKIKEYNQKYKNEVTFIGINCRDDRNSWLTISEKHNIDWINLFSANKELTELFGVVAYPTKLLIDKEGKIILKTIGGNNEVYMLIDEILNH